MNNQYMYEFYFDDISDTVELATYESLGGDIDDYLYEDFYTEGANLDARAYFKQYKREFKVLTKRLKQQVKSYNYDDARKTLKECDDKITEGIEKVQAIDYGDMGSFIFSLFSGFLPNLGRTMALSLIPFVGVGVAQAVSLYDKFFALVNSIKRTVEKGEEITLDNFNMYKNLLIQKMKNMKQSIKKYYAVLGTVEKADKSGKLDKKKKEKK